MEQIKLYRSSEVEQAWQERKNFLIQEWRRDHQGWEFTHLFDEEAGNIQWLMKQGVPIREQSAFWMLENDFKYEDVIMHYTIIPRAKVLNYQKTNIMMLDLFECIVNAGYKDYAIVKKSEGSINFPHWHLLIY